MKFLGTALLCSTLMFGAAAVAAPQPISQHDREREENAAYRDGYRRGQDDARDRRPANSGQRQWHSRADRTSYENGYTAGYHDFMRDRRDDRHDDRRDDHRGPGYGQPGYGQPGYGQPGYGQGGYMAQARRIGYDEGVADGQKDKRTGHSFRPTEGDNYKGATHGYSSNMGDKQAYKDMYRQGYIEGYRLGYNGRR